MIIRNILVPIDFSTCALELIDRATALAGQLGARLTLLHVAEVPEGVGLHATIAPLGLPVDAAEWVEQATASRMEPLLERVRAAGVGAKGRAVAGPVVRTILAAATAEQADLLVLSTHGRTGLARTLLGSVSEEVARHSPVPVLTIRREARADCHRGSCQWCAAGGLSPEEAQLAAEGDG